MDTLSGDARENTSVLILKFLKKSIFEKLAKIIKVTRLISFGGA